MAGASKLLQLVKKCHQLLGIFHWQPSQTQSSINSIRALYLISLAQYMFTLVTFVVLESESMMEYGFGFFLLISIMNNAATYSIYIWQSENTLKFIENCDEFVEKRVESAATYNESIAKIERFNKLLWFSISTTQVLQLLLPGVVSFVKYYIVGMGEDSFELFLPAWFPFDWKTPVGYLIAWLSQCAGVMSSVCIGVQFINLLIGSCWLIIVIAKDITKDVVAFNFTAETAKSNETRTESTKRFCDMVQIYSDAKE